MGGRTCRTYTRIRRRNEDPCVCRERKAQVGDHGEAIGVEGGEAECWTPDMEFERHGWVGGDGVVECLLLSLRSRHWGTLKGLAPSVPKVVPKAGR